ncbi:MAG: site-2 protease family protein [Candidatus Roizmanbacteria bacterium]|nr:site-2 protease family protein [Candidatus Roizmanbacteria bacterium]
MIFTLFSNPILFLLLAISIVVAVTVHEFAHAKMAEHLGDPTASLQGRVTLNPMAHLDLYGTIFLLLVGFGWGKPVQFDPFNLDNPRRDGALISFAGPASNFIIAIICALLAQLFIFLGIPALTTIGLLILSPMIMMNVMLGVFNLLPVHPLDGFKIVAGLLTESQARDWNHLQRYGMLFLLMLIIPFGGQSMLHSILDPVLGFLYGILLPSQFSLFV